MANIFDRLATGALQPSDFNAWNQSVGSAPPDRFQQAAQQAIQQVPTNEYYQHIQPGVSGTDPLGSLPQDQSTGIAQSLLTALIGHDVGANDIQQYSGVQTIDPQQMSPQDLANLLQWTKQNRPGVLGQVATQYQNQPSILHSILSNRAVMGLAIGLGAKLLTVQLSQRQRANLGTGTMM